MKEQKPEFVKITEEVYDSFEETITEIRTTDAAPKTGILLDLLIASAYTKTYDFFMFLCKEASPKNSFFYIPMLRGICEDFIALTYILSKDKREQDSLLITKKYEEINKTLDAQILFLNKHRPNQKVVPIDTVPNLEQAIELYNKKNGWEIEKKKLPNTFDMARKVGLQDVYKFIYHGTSKAVHFDIITLLGLGWGKLDNDKETLDTKFSYKNDYRQDFTFVFFYTSKLFTMQSKSFEKKLKIPKEMIEILDILEEKNQINDWPTIITFEKMNLKSN